ncbi:MAG: hypothetical protein IJ058_03330 [Lachnospiraceae bacterium]|nr:hypothetical protein [Lachnospiraceae bacterium]
MIKVFEKKDIIYSSTMGLCVVSDVTKLAADKSTPIPYYVLRSYYDRSRVAYIPVEDHEVELRDVISEAEAVKKFESIKTAYAGDPDYKPDALEVGEIAYVYRITPDELLKQAGAPEENDEE